MHGPGQIENELDLPSTTRNQRHMPAVVGEILFDSMREAQYYLRCGQHRQKATPCVDIARLDVTYALVYEKWQRIKTSSKPKEWFRCRRRAGCREKNAVRHVDVAGRKRKAKQISEYVGCGCEARYTMQQCVKSGKVRLTFRGKHNHDVQRQYAARFLNPIQECFQIRQIVDDKLFAGVFNVQKILSAVLNETFMQREKHSEKHTSFEQLRTYLMATFINRQQIRNRIMQLGLNPDRLTNKFVLLYICVCVVVNTFNNEHILNIMSIF